MDNDELRRKQKIQNGVTRADVHEAVDGWLDKLFQSTASFADGDEMVLKLMGGASDGSSSATIRRAAIRLTEMPEPITREAAVAALGDDYEVTLYTVFSEEKIWEWVT